MARSLNRTCRMHLPSKGATVAKDDRFEKVYQQGGLTGMQIWVDKQTGVNYLFHFSGYAGGLTPLLDRYGNPVVSPVTHE